MTINPIAAASGPDTVSHRPNRGTARPAITADTALPRAKGVTARPDRSGEYPRPSWRNRASTSQIPVIPVK